MKKLLKKVLALSLCACMVVGMATGASAVDSMVLRLPKCASGETIRVPIDDAQFIDDGKGNIISISDLLSFDTREEAGEYVENMAIQLQTPTQYSPKINWNARATHGDALVAKQNVSYGSINLRVVYTTSGDYHTGKVTYHKAYTSFTGFTLGFGWDERMCISQVEGYQKDIYVAAAGDLTWNFLVDGFIELGRTPINLSGFCYAIR